LGNDKITKYFAKIDLLKKLLYFCNVKIKNSVFYETKFSKYLKNCLLVQIFVLNLHRQAKTNLL